MSDYIIGNTDTTAQEIGFSRDRLKLLADYNKKLVDKGRVQAAGFLLAREGKIFANQTIGKLTHKNDSSLYKPGSIKRIASISKLFTATAIMKLVEDGVLWLDQPVSTILDEFDTSMHKTIHIRHLLTHTSGLAADSGFFLEPYSLNLFSHSEKEDWLKQMLAGPVQSAPGETWSYCSFGFVVLAEIVSRVSGFHFYDYVEKNIFKPLGMTRTFIEIPENLKSEICFNSDFSEEMIQKNIKKNREGAPNGGSAVYSTMEDLFKFGQCFLNGGTYKGVRLLGKTTCEAMTRNQLEGVPSFHWGKNLKDFSYGLGWGFTCDGPLHGEQVYNHEGFGWASINVDPKEEFIYISMYADNADFDPEIMVMPRSIAWSGLESN